jgi:Ca2+-binding RTX toxin-like protein
MRRLVLLAATAGLFLALGADAAFAATLIGTDGPDVLDGTGGRDDRILGKAGEDTITGGAGEEHPTASTAALVRTRSS